MDTLVNTLKEKRGVRDSTIKIYKRMLNRLSQKINKKDYENRDFLKSKQKEIIEFLNTQTDSVKKNFISSILIALSPEAKRTPLKGFKEAYDKYNNILLEEHKKYYDGIKDKQKNEKESKNWMEWDDILKYMRKLAGKIRKLGYTQKSDVVKSKKDLDLLQQYLVLSLYTLHSPRRLEYADIKVVDNGEFNKLSSSEKDNNIYLVKISRNKKFFSFGKNAVKSETSENVKIPVDRQLNSVINLWLNFNKSDHFLLDSRGNKLTKNGLTKFIQKIFRPLDKNISASMLRKIKVSHEFDPAIEDKKKKMAKEMNHSVDIQQKVYSKK